MTVQPPPGVEVIPARGDGPVRWRWWPVPHLTQVELWLFPAVPGVRRASVTVASNGVRTYRDPGELAVVEHMYAAAGEWLTDERANDGSQLNLMDAMPWEPG